MKSCSCNWKLKITINPRLHIIDSIKQHSCTRIILIKIQVYKQNVNKYKFKKYIALKLNIKTNMLLKQWLYCSEILKFMLTCYHGSLNIAKQHTNACTIFYYIKKGVSMAS